MESYDEAPSLAELRFLCDSRQHPVTAEQLAAEVKDLLERAYRQGFEDAVDDEPSVTEAFSAAFMPGFNAVDHADPDRISFTVGLTAFTVGDQVEILRDMARTDLVGRRGVVTAIDGMAAEVEVEAGGGLLVKRYYLLEALQSLTTPTETVAASPRVLDWICPCHGGTSNERGYPCWRCGGRELP